MDGTVVCALSFRHGPRGQGFEGVSTGVDFHVFGGGTWGGVKSDKIRKVFLQKLGSGLVVQRFRYHLFAQFFAL